MAEPQDMAVANRNLIQALDYLIHLEKLRTRPIARLAEHKLPVFFESDFSGFPGVATGLIDGATEIWLAVRRLRPQAPPNLHPSLSPWVSLSNDPSKRPVIAESIEAELPLGRIEVRLAEVPEIEQRFRQYCVAEWEPWSLTEQPRRQSIGLYDRLFSLLQDVDVGGGADGAIEIAWGVGVALWNHPESGTEIRYPIISQTVEIHVDERSMDIVVTPTDRAPMIHVDSFEELGISQSSIVAERARREFANSEKTFSPFDQETFEGILRFARAHFDPQGVYWPENGAANVSDRRLPPISDHLIVTDTWVIFARKRTTHFITADIERLKETVSQTASLPPAPALIVTEPSDEVPRWQRNRYRGLSTPGLVRGDENGGSLGPDGDLFFPKPFNAEQVTIVERLDQSAGAVVQGPPGTGKTHTIANIVCHYLALGKRVLVTSQHEAPLAVLQEQIPEAIRPLTIALLTSERDGLQQLEQAVRKIASEVIRPEVS